MGAVETPFVDRIHWRSTPTGAEGESRLGRYVLTRREYDTFDVEFVSGGRWEVIGERLTEGEAYRKIVDDNKKRLGVTGGGSQSGAVRRRQDAPVCPECNMAPNGECP